MRIVISGCSFPSFLCNSDSCSLYRNPNSPDDVGQYVGSVWPQFDVNKHAYMYMSGDVGRQAVKSRLSPTSDAFISLAISLSEASSLEGQRCPTHPPNVVDPGLVG